MKHAVFFHVATMNDYQRIVDETFTLMSSSGIMKTSERIFVGIAGDGPLALPAKVETAARFGLGEFEFPTLKLLRNHARQNLDHALLYIHTKGVSTPGNPCIEDWRKYMLHFLVTRYSQCLDVLSVSDTCGVDLRPLPVSHYSGNFWWTKASHVSMLPDFETMPTILSERHKAEFWVCSKGDKHHSLWDCGIGVNERHLHLYPSIKYQEASCL